MNGNGHPLSPQTNNGGSGIYYTDIRLTADPEDNVVGASLAKWRVPVAATLLGVEMWMATGPTGSVATVDINEAGVSVLSTKLTIDANETTSNTAAAAAVISDAALAAGAEMTIDFDGVGASTPGKGTVVRLIWRAA